MTSFDIIEILKGNFCDSSDREYWEKKLAKALTKEQDAKENEEYYKAMAIYAR